LNQVKVNNQSDNCSSWKRQLTVNKEQIVENSVDNLLKTGELTIFLWKSPVEKKLPELSTIVFHTK